MKLTLHSKTCKVVKIESDYYVEFIGGKLQLVYPKELNISRLLDDDVYLVGTLLVFPNAVKILVKDIVK